MGNKIVRTICQFTDSPNQSDAEKLKRLQSKFESAGFEVQTIRVCTNQKDFKSARESLGDKEIRLSIGSKTLAEAQELLPEFHSAYNIHFNVELAKAYLDLRYIELLFDIIKHNAANTFNFTYIINGVPTPYFPSALYRENGFAVGLQSTDLAENVSSLQEWFEKMKELWLEVSELMADEPDFLGIDSSIAPLFQGKSSLINFVKRLKHSFDATVTSDIYTQMTEWIKTQNPKPYGLNGLMLPCLEDFELADEYARGGFSIERNMFLSLHSGLGIDTYPIGVDERPERVLEILKLVQALSNKYQKPLAARFVSDGKARVGELTSFQNQYLKDILVRQL